MCREPRTARVGGWRPHCTGSPGGPGPGPSQQALYTPWEVPGFLPEEEHLLLYAASQLRIKESLICHFSNKYITFLNMKKSQPHR